MPTALQMVAGHVAADQMYTGREIMRRLGLGLHAMPTARKIELRVLRIVRCDDVLGADLIKFAEQTNEPEISSSQALPQQAEH